MALHRRVDQPDGVRELPGVREIRFDSRSGVVAVGSMACPGCDAPVMPDRPLRPADPIGCGFCGTQGAVRDFLALGEPARPARVEVRVRGGA